MSSLAACLAMPGFWLPTDATSAWSWILKLIVLWAAGILGLVVACTISVRVRTACFLWLAWILLERKEGKTHVERREEGVHIESLDVLQLLPRSVWNALLAGSPIELHSFRVDKFHVTLPTLSRKLVVSVDGVHIAFRQKSLPERTDINARNREQRRKAAAEKKRRLAIAETLLWSLDEGRQDARGDFHEYLDSWLAWLPARLRPRSVYSRLYQGLGTCLHLVASFVLEGCAFYGQDMSLVLFQDSVPGPTSPARPSSGHREGVRLQVRAARLSPPMRAFGPCKAVVAKAVAAARSSADASRISAQTRPPADQSSVDSWLQRFAEVAFRMAPGSARLSRYMHIPVKCKLAVEGVSLCTLTTLQPGPGTGVAPTPGGGVPPARPPVFRGADGGSGSGQPVPSGGAAAAGPSDAGPSGRDAAVQERADAVSPAAWGLPGDSQWSRRTRPGPAVRVARKRRIVGDATSAPAHEHQRADVPGAAPQAPPLGPSQAFLDWASVECVFQHWGFDVVIMSRPAHTHGADDALTAAPGRPSAKADTSAAASHPTLSSARSRFQSLSIRVPSPTGSHQSSLTTAGTQRGGDSTSRPFFRNSSRVTTTLPRIIETDAMVSALDSVGLRHVAGDRAAADPATARHRRSTSTESLDSGIVPTLSASHAHLAPASPSPSDFSAPSLLERSQERASVDAFSFPEGSPHSARPSSAGVPFALGADVGEPEAPPLNGGLKEAGAAASAPPSASGKVLLSVKIDMRALSPDFNLTSVAVLGRVTARLAAFANLADAWAVRPQVSVKESPAAWWKHAVNMVVSECRKVRRQQVPFRQLQRRRVRKAQYTELYIAKHSRDQSFQAHDHKWWDVWRSAAAKARPEAHGLLAREASSEREDPAQRKLRQQDSIARRRLEAIEGQLTLDELEEILSLEEIIHFRMGAALQHSKLFVTPRDHHARALHPAGSRSLWESFSVSRAPPRSGSSPPASSPGGSRHRAGASAPSAAVPAAGHESIFERLTRVSSGLNSVTNVTNEASAFWSGSQSGEKGPARSGDLDEGGSPQEMFRNHIMMILHVLATGSQTPLAPNMEAVILGQKIYPPGFSDAFPLAVSCRVNLPKLGLSVSVPQPALTCAPSQTTFSLVLAGLTLCVTPAMRVQVTLDSACCGVDARTATEKAPSSDTPLFRSPCLSTILLTTSTANLSADATSLQPPHLHERFLTLQYFPPSTPSAGSATTRMRLAHTSAQQAAIAPTDDERDSARAAASASAPVQPTLQPHVEDRPRASAPGLLASGCARGGTTTTACRMIQHRRQLMTSEVLLGSVDVAVAPIEVHLLSEKLLQLLQMAALAGAAINAGDAEFSRHVGAKHTAQEVLASGSCRDMVHDGLVRHKVPVLPAQPPLFPAVNVACGGLVVRINADLPSSEGAARDAPPPSTAVPPTKVSPSASALDAREFELEIALTGVHAHVLGRYEGVRQSNHIALEGGLHLNVDASFKRVDLQRLLAAGSNPFVGHCIQSLYATAVKAWTHPHDGELRLRECLMVEQRIKELFETEKSIRECLEELGESRDDGSDEARKLAQCKLAGMYVCGRDCSAELAPQNIMETRRPSWIPLLPDVSQSSPIIPVARMDGFASRNVFLFPRTPAVAGNLDCIMSCRASGLLIWLSEWQVQLLTHFVDSLGEVLSKMLEVLGAISPTSAAPQATSGQGLPLPASNLHSIASFHLPFITVLGFLCHPPAANPEITPLASAGAQPAQQGTPRSHGAAKEGFDMPPSAAWVGELPLGNFARICGRRLAPVLDISVLDLRFGVDVDASVHATVIVGAFLLQDLHPRAPSTDAFGKVLNNLLDAASGAAAERRNCLALDWSPSAVRIGPCQRALEHRTAQTASKLRRRMLQLTSARRPIVLWRRLMQMYLLQRRCLDLQSWTHPTLGQSDPFVGGSRMTTFNRIALGLTDLARPQLLVQGSVRGGGEYVLVTKLSQAFSSWALTGNGSLILFAARLTSAALAPAPRLVAAPPAAAPRPAAIIAGGPEHRIKSIAVSVVIDAARLECAAGGQPFLELDMATIVAAARFKAGAHSDELRLDLEIDDLALQDCRAPGLHRYLLVRRPPPQAPPSGALLQGFGAEPPRERFLTLQALQTVNHRGGSRPEPPSVELKFAQPRVTLYVRLIMDIVYLIYNAVDTIGPYARSFFPPPEEPTAATAPPQPPEPQPLFPIELPFAIQIAVKDIMIVIPEKSTRDGPVNCSSAIVALCRSLDFGAPLAVIQELGRGREAGDLVEACVQDRLAVLERHHRIATTPAAAKPGARRNEGDDACAGRQDSASVSFDAETGPAAAGGEACVDPAPRNELQPVEEQEHLAPTDARPAAAATAAAAAATTVPAAAASPSSAPGPQPSAQREGVPAAFSPPAAQALGALVCDTFDIFVCDVEAAPHDALPPVAGAPHRSRLSSTLSWGPTKRVGDYAPRRSRTVGEAEGFSSRLRTNGSMSGHRNDFPQAERVSGPTASAIIAERFTGGLVPSLLEKKVFVVQEGRMVMSIMGNDSTDGWLTISLHLAFEACSGTVSPACYWHVLQTIWGNMFETSVLDPVGGAPPVSESQFREYNPVIGMWPPTSAPVCFMLTASVPQGNLVLETDPRTWERADGKPGPVDSSPRVPFLMAEATGFSLCVSVVPVEVGRATYYETYVSGDVKSFDMFDLRLARYHLLRSYTSPSSAENSRASQTAVSARDEFACGPAASSGSDDEAQGSAPSGLAPLPGTVFLDEDAIRSESGDSDYYSQHTHHRRQRPQDGAAASGGVPTLRDVRNANESRDQPAAYPQTTPLEPLPMPSSKPPTAPIPNRPGLDVILLRDLQSGKRLCDQGPAPDFGHFYRRLYRNLTPELPEGAFSDSSNYLDVQVPVVHLVKAPFVFQRKESVHFNQERGKAEGSCQLAYCMKWDGTMAVEMVVSQQQARWPWLLEIGIVQGVLSIACPLEKWAVDPVPKQLFPWMYTNIVLDRVQLVVPVGDELLDVHDRVVKVVQQMEEMVERGQSQKQSAAAGPSAAQPRLVTRSKSFYDLVLRLAERDAALKALLDGLSGQVLEEPGLFQMICQAMLESVEKQLYGACFQSARGSTDLDDSSASRSDSWATGQSSYGSDSQRDDSGLSSRLFANTDVLFTTRAIVLTSQAVRYGYYYGGDGIEIMVADVWKAAGHVHHDQTCVECWLLPCSFNLQLDRQTPHMQEMAELRALSNMAVKMQRWFRLAKARRAQLDAARPAAARFLAALPERAASSNAPRRLSLIDDLIRSIADDGEKEQIDNFHKHRPQSKLTLVNRSPTRSRVVIKGERVNVRIAFSHLPMHRLLIRHLPVLGSSLRSRIELFMSHEVEAMLFSMVDPPTRIVDERRAQAKAAAAQVVYARGGSEDSAKAAAAKVHVADTFRRMHLTVEVRVDEAGCALCNDSQNSFGAPDILYGTLSQVDARAELRWEEENRSPNVTLHSSTKAAISFLDNASSQWDRLLYPWRFQSWYSFEHLRLTESARVVWLGSDERMLTTFNPAFLLTAGDVKAFVTALLAKAPPEAPPAMAAAMAVPPMAEQMAIRASITDRKPQRYWMQNHCGLTLWYWGAVKASEAAVEDPPPVRAGRFVPGVPDRHKHKLPTGRSEELKCMPLAKRITMQQGGQANTRQTRDHSVISLLFEGNWLPLHDVLINQVGKYRYQLYNPHENHQVNLIVDIILVGRTKVISVHSPIWIANNTSLPLHLRLHIPASSLVAAQSLRAAAQTAATGPTRGFTKSHRTLSSRLASPRSRSAHDLPQLGNGPQTNDDFLLKVVKPNRGMYLPVVAQLQGVLYLRPDGHHESQQDVLRLGNDLHQLQRQQGFLRTSPILPDGGSQHLDGSMPFFSFPRPSGGDGRAVDPVTQSSCFLKIVPEIPGKQDFGMVKHMEHRSGGTFRAANIGETGGPLVASVYVEPTITLTNALPYDARITVFEAWLLEGSGDTLVRNPAPEQAPSPRRAAGPHRVSFCDWIAGLPSDPNLTAKLQDKSSPIHSLVATGQMGGRHITVKAKPGQNVKVYADLKETVVVYMEVAALGLHSVNWTAINWGRHQQARPASSDRPRPRFDPLHRAFGSNRALKLPKTMLLSYENVKPRGGADRRASAMPNFCYISRTDSHNRILLPHLIEEDAEHHADGTPVASARAQEGPALGPAALDSSSVRGELEIAGASGAGPSGSSGQGRALDAPEAAGSSARVRIIDAPTTSERAAKAWARAAAKAIEAPKSGVYAPQVLQMGIVNSLRRKKRGQAEGMHACMVTFYAPFWVDNRTAVDLSFIDSFSSTISTSYLRVPGNQTGVRLGEYCSDTVMAAAALKPPSLMNSEKNVQFCILSADGSSKGHLSKAINVRTVGTRPSVTLYGPQTMPGKMIHELLMEGFERVRGRSEAEPSQPSGAPSPDAGQAAALGEQGSPAGAVGGALPGTVIGGARPRRSVLSDSPTMLHELPGRPAPGSEPPSASGPLGEAARAAADGDVGAVARALLSAAEAGASEQRSLAPVTPPPQQPRTLAADAVAGGGPPASQPRGIDAAGSWRGSPASAAALRNSVGRAQTPQPLAWPDAAARSAGSVAGSRDAAATPETEPLPSGGDPATPDLPEASRGADSDLASCDDSEPVESARERSRLPPEVDRGPLDPAADAEIERDRSPTSQDAGGLARSLALPDHLASMHGLVSSLTSAPAPAPGSPSQTNTTTITQDLERSVFSAAFSATFSAAFSADGARDGARAYASSTVTSPDDPRELPELVDVSLSPPEHLAAVLNRIERSPGRLNPASGSLTFPAGSGGGSSPHSASFRLPRPAASLGDPAAGPIAEGVEGGADSDGGRSGPAPAERPARARPDALDVERLGSLSNDASGGYAGADESSGARGRLVAGVLRSASLSDSGASGLINPFAGSASLSGAFPLSPGSTAPNSVFEQPSGHEAAFGSGVTLNYPSLEGGWSRDGAPSPQGTAAAQTRGVQIHEARGTARQTWRPGSAVPSISERPERSRGGELLPNLLRHSHAFHEVHGCFGSHLSGSRGVVPEYEFAVEVSSGPPNSCFRHTKILHIKDKYIVHNQTGMALEVRQKHAPPGTAVVADPLRPEGPRTLLAVGAACPMHWDNSDLPHLVVVRPVLPAAQEVCWSGGFRLQEQEDYFGLRVHYVQNGAPTNMILPVSISVGSAGVVLVSIKAPENVPPYRIENLCKAVRLQLKQLDVVEHAYDTLEPNQVEAFAWDEPDRPHGLDCIATVVSTNRSFADSGASKAFRISSIDDLKAVETVVIESGWANSDLPTLLPTSKNGESSAEHEKSRRALLLARDASKRVQVTIFADGPTRVLRFSDPQSTSVSIGQSVHDMCTRVAKLEEQLAMIDRKFISLRGKEAGGQMLDLFGHSYDVSHPSATLPGVRGSQASLPEFAALEANSGAKSPASSQRAVSQGTNAMSSAKAERAALMLLISGDLTVKNLQIVGISDSVNAFIHLHVPGKGQSTSVKWATAGPSRQIVPPTRELKWADEVTFQEVCAASELTVMVYDIMGESRPRRKAARSTVSSEEVIKKSRFLGMVSVPLQESVDAAISGLGMSQTRTLKLSRRFGSDVVPLDARITLTLVWHMSVTSLLKQKEKALGNVLQQRQEILSYLEPIKVAETAEFVLQGPWSHSGLQNCHPDRRSDAALRPPVREQLLNVSVSVLEVMNIPTRGASNAVKINFSNAPNPAVRVRFGPETHEWTTAERDVNASFDKRNRHEFEAVPRTEALEVFLLDRRKRDVVCGVVTIPCEKLPAPDPVYMWVQVEHWDAHHGKHFSRARLKSLLLSPMLVHLRIQVTPVVPLSSTIDASLDFVGAGLMVVSSLEDELLSFTLHHIKINAFFTKKEVKSHGSIRGLQIDDQSLDVEQPVVLGSIGALAQTMNRFPRANPPAQQAVDVAVDDEPPLLQWNVIRSRYIGSTIGPASVGPPHSARSPPAASPDQRGGILSFRLIEVKLGPMDFTGQESFLVGVFSYVVSLPWGDVTQTKAWQQHQERLLNTGVAVNQTTAQELARSWLEPSGRSADALGFLRAKRLSEAEALRAQNNDSSWFFIEELSISELYFNVTVQMTSNIISATDIFANSDEEGQSSAGLFGHIVRSSGFQLINVHNVAIHYDHKQLRNMLLSRNSLVANLVRHYFQQSIKEAHKVLGGAGPSVAQVPLTVVWAGGGLYDLTRDLASRRAGALAVVPKLGFITLSSVAQFTGVLSTSLAALLAAIPYDRINDHLTPELSDAATMRRYIIRPHNALEAFQMSWHAVITSFSAAIAGLVLDPVTGWRKGRTLGAMLGGCKALAGLPLRPIAGMAEFVSKGSQALALLCLGKQGIQGRVMRRVYAPGATERLHSVKEQDTEKEELRRQVWAAWQRSLPMFSSKLASDKLVELVYVRINRALVVTTRHALYCKSSHVEPGVINYRLRWLVQLQDIHTITGDEKTLQVALRAWRTLRLLRGLRVPATYQLHTGDLESFQHVLVVLNKHSNNVGEPESFEPSRINFKDLPVERLQITAPQEA